MRSSMRARDRGVLRVARPGHEQHRHRELGERVPHRLHRARAEPAQARGEELRREPAAVGDARRVGRERSRTSAARASARGTRRRRRARRCRRAARRPRRARRARPASAMPGDALTSTSAAHEVGPVEREPQAQPAAHRVADVDPAAARVADRAARSPRRSPAAGTSSARTVARLARRPRPRPTTSVAVCVKPGTSTTRGRGTRAFWPAATGATMTERDATTAFAAALVDEWARAGVTDAVVAPGSRSAPLALALARDDRVRVHVVLDERSAAFRALGHRARDRAARGRAVHVGHRGRELPSRGDRGVARARAAARVHRRPAAGAARHGRGADDRPGAPLRPRGALVLRSGPARRRARRGRDVARAREPRGSPRRSGRRPGRCTSTSRSASRCSRPARRWSTRRAAPTAGRGRVSTPAARAPERGRRRAPRRARARAPARAARRGLGRGRGAARPRRGSRRPPGWPVLADPISQLRTGPHAISTYEALLRAPGFADAHRPDLVVRVGAPLTSKIATALARPVDRAGARRSRRPTGSTRTTPRPSASRSTPSALLARGRRRAGARRRRDRRGCDDWLRRRAAGPRRDRRACSTRPTAPFEGRIARDVAAALPDGATLVVASSLPVRALEWCMAPRDRPARARQPRRQRHRRVRVDGRRRRAGERAGADRRPVRRPVLPARHRTGCSARPRPRRSSCSTTTAAASSRTCRPPSCPSSSSCSRRRTASISWRSRAAHGAARGAHRRRRQARRSRARAGRRSADVRVLVVPVDRHASVDTAPRAVGRGRRPTARRRRRWTRSSRRYGRTSARSIGSSFDLGLGPLGLGVRAGDDARARVQAGAVAVDLRAAQRDDELAVAVGVDPAARPGVEIARRRFEPGDRRERGRARRAGDGRASGAARARGRRADVSRSRTRAVIVVARCDEVGERDRRGAVRRAASSHVGASASTHRVDDEPVLARRPSRSRRARRRARRCRPSAARSRRDRRGARGARGSRRRSRGRRRRCSPAGSRAARRRSARGSNGCVGLDRRPRARARPSRPRPRRSSASTAATLGFPLVGRR